MMRDDVISSIRGKMGNWEGRLQLRRDRRRIKKSNQEMSHLSRVARNRGWIIISRDEYAMLIGHLHDVISGETD